MNNKKIEYLQENYLIATLLLTENIITKRAIWNGKEIAESDDLANIEGNYYFPESSLNEEFFKPSSTSTNCHWKGDANYKSLEGQTNADAAWYYADPKDAIKAIKWRYAFWKGVTIEDV